MRDIILTLIVFAAIPVALARPAIGLLVWSWLGYMNPHRLTWGFAYSFPFVMISAVATLIGMMFTREKLRFPWTATTVVWGLLVLWMCVTTLFALMPELAVAEWQRSMKIQLMVLATLLMMNTRERLIQLVWVIAMSIGFFGIKGGLFTAATGGSYRVWGPPGSFVEGNNEIALALLMVVPLMRFLQLQATQVWLKRALVGGMILCAFSIVGSWSRGAFVGGIAMVLYFWMKSRNKLLFGIPLILTAVIAVSFMPDEWFERMGTIRTYQEDDSALGRINAWWFAFNLANDRPIVGGGFQVFDASLFARYAPEPERVHDAHSIYFEMLGEQGYVGLALFLTLGWLAMRSGNWVVRNVRERPDLRWAAELAKMVQVGLVGYATGGAFLGLAYFDLPYHMISVLVLTRVIVQRELAKPPPAEVPESVEPQPARGRAALRPRRTLPASRWSSR